MIPQVPYDYHRYYHISVIHLLKNDSITTKILDTGARFNDIQALFKQAGSMHIHIGIPGPSAAITPNPSPFSRSLITSNSPAK